MAGGPRVYNDLTAFVEAMAGCSAGRIVTTIYGIPLRNGRGERAAYVGRSEEGMHPGNMLEALRPPKSCDGARHPDLHNVPGRLFLLWQKGFYYWPDKPMCLLRGVPKSAETAAARAIEDLLGEGKALGGILALDQRVDVVRDACTLQRLHDQGACCKCGRKGHSAASCSADLSVVADGDLPYRQQLAERRVGVLQQKFQKHSAALHAATLQSSSIAQGSSRASPEAAEAASRELGQDADGDDGGDAGGVASSAPAGMPIRPLVPRRTRLRGKQAPPRVPMPQPEHLQGASPDRCRRWNRVAGVSHVPQSHASRGPRRSFQVSVAKAQLGPAKLYFKYQEATLAGAQPCHFGECWQKLPGQPLFFCGRDVCAYDAAVACHSGLFAVLPDKRRRLPEASVDEGAAPPCDLEAWGNQWL